MRIHLGIISVFYSRLKRLYYKSDFLKTGRDEREVYVHPLRKSADRGRFMWLLIAVSYGLASSNRKLQVLSDNVLLSIGIEPVALFPQRFPLFQWGQLVAEIPK